MIKIKSAEVRRLLGIDGKYASVRDFFSDVNEYKLEKPLRGIDRFADPQGLREAAEICAWSSAAVLLIISYMILMRKYKDAKTSES